MNLIDRIADTLINIEIALRGIPAPSPGPMTQPKKAAPKPPKVDSRIKYTASGIPYREETPEGQEVSAWSILHADTSKGPAVLSDDEHAAARQKGFASDTVVQVKRLWAEGISQREIAKRAGVGIDTVKKLTPIFGKQVQKGAKK